MLKQFSMPPVEETIVKKQIYFMKLADCADFMSQARKFCAGLLGGSQTKLTQQGAKRRYKMTASGFSDTP
ncbi:hypothetical protein A7K91_02680 [Paenibacillus oryzae]|uniref:Uncharacterized protein n=1 Tax=Paenibacillus oryzae TaxID=1844972 RepID=A0A1A5YUI4_9BACL|nr:hypothetical protein A7K91_02680 [Paenibacillus oryzae]